jgi:hypothetical protein
MGWCWR